MLGRNYILGIVNGQCVMFSGVDFEMGYSIANEVNEM